MRPSRAKTRCAGCGRKADESYVLFSWPFYLDTPAGRKYFCGAVCQRDWLERSSVGRRHLDGLKMAIDLNVLIFPKEGGELSDPNAKPIITVFVRSVIVDVFKKHNTKARKEHLIYEDGKLFVFNKGKKKTKREEFKASNIDWVLDGIKEIIDSI